MSIIKAVSEGIAKAIASEFTDKSIEIYTEEIKQGLKAPAFFIQCLDQQQTMLLSSSSRFNRVHDFCVQYFPESETAFQEECADAAERLEMALHLITATDDDQPILGTDMHFSVTGGVLSFFVTYEFHVRNTDSTSEEVMETMTESQDVQEG